MFRIPFSSPPSPQSNNTVNTTSINMSDALSTRHQKQLVLSATGSSFEPLDLDVISEILSWLPAKTLLRFRCVSKPWRTLLSDPCFITKHLTRIKSDYSFIVHHYPSFDDHDYDYDYDSEIRHRFTLLKCSGNYDGPVYSRELYFPVIDPLFDSMLIIGSCNGLICLLLNWHTVMLWNPCTREYNVLPEPPLETKNDSEFHGFGYDSTSHDYKVVVGNFLTESSDGCVFFFTLRTGSWRKVESPNLRVVCRRGCLVNEALHWVRTEKDEDGGKIDSKLVSFDLAEEKFHEIPSRWYLNPIEGCNLLPQLHNIRNCLTLWEPRGRFDDYMRMWVMKENGVEKSWTQVMKIPLEVLCHCDYSSPLCIFDDGVALMDVLLVSGYGNDNVLKLHNPKERKCRNITEPSDSATVAYMETLVSPLTGGGV